MDDVKKVVINGADDSKKDGIDFSKLTTEEIFKVLKESVTQIDESKLKSSESNLLKIIKSGTDSGQAILVEKSLFMYDTLKKEEFLLEHGYQHYISKEDISKVKDALEAKNDRNILFVEATYYPRTIPDEIVERLKFLRDHNIFDSYYILYTDYTHKGRKIANGDINQPSKKDVKKDPILFGAFVKPSEIVQGMDMMNDRLYVIGDWEDEYCDLTLDKIIEVIPEVVKDINLDETVLLNAKEQVEKAKQNELAKRRGPQTQSVSESQPVKKGFWAKVKGVFGYGKAS